MPEQHIRHTCVECLVAIARHHGLDLSVAGIVHEFALAGEVGADELVRIASSSDLKAQKFHYKWKKLRKLGQAFPALIYLKRGGCAVITGFDEQQRAIILDPLSKDAEPVHLDRKQLEQIWTGEILLIRRKYKQNSEDRPFNLKWFLPEIWRQKASFRDVILAALFLNVLGLVIPVFFQIVIDKVLVHHTLATLQVLVIGVIIAILFEAALSYMRSYVLLHANRKIDIRLTTRTYNHMLDLPTKFFNHTSAGVLTKHMQQTERIREFLTGNALTTLLDLSVLLIFLPVLWFYSPYLTLVVLGFTALVGGFIGSLLKTFQRRLHALYNAEGARQAMLVETINGAATIKALALEPQQRRLWETLSANTVERMFDVGRISLKARTVSHMLEQLMSVAVISIGVFLVMNQSMTVGELIAFQMLSNRVSQPLIQAITLIHEYQETGLAVKMLGHVMNAKPERPSKTRAMRPKIRGEIEFKNVYFKYPGAPDYALQDINVRFPAGTMTGIVGLSGSGKTTMSRLIQVLYPVINGSIRLDGIDLREIDLAYLRSNIGVVLQESFLFHGTIRENIGRTKPDATIEEIVEAARLAGAHEFVTDLPHKYDTVLEEGAVNLSGGQRQRLSIARAILRNPQVLILDEATSALDPDSEYIIQQNLKEIARGRTLISISHRMSMIRDADQILVMHKGRVHDLGTHDELLARNEIYHGLWTRQMSEGRP